MSHGTPAGVVVLHPLTPEQVQLVERENTIALNAQTAAQAIAQQQWLAKQREIQDAFVAQVQPVLDAYGVREADASRFTYDANGVLCLEVVRRGAAPDAAPVNDP